jgi:hypothetical protein
MVVDVLGLIEDDSLILNIFLSVDLARKEEVALIED